MANYRLSNQIRFCLLIAVITLSGCAPDSSGPMVGNDRDNYGCMVSAGYQWCQAQNKCVRSWELAKKKGFDNSPEAFKQFCDRR